MSSISESFVAAGLMEAALVQAGEQIGQAGPGPPPRHCDRPRPSLARGFHPRMHGFAAAVGNGDHNSASQMMSLATARQIRTVVRRRSSAGEREFIVLPRCGGLRAAD